MGKSGYKVFFHIGLQKTGTSALQATLYENIELLSKHGILYPKPICNYPAHQELAWSMAPEIFTWRDNDYDKEQVYDRYVQLILESDLPIVILSSEDLSLLKNVHHIEYIKEKFKWFDVKVIVYIRDPLEVLLSHYHHKLRDAEEMGTFRDFLCKIRIEDYVDYTEFLKGWAEVFGLEKIILRKYKSQSLIYDFLSCILPNFDANTLKVKENRVNVGIHPWLNSAYRELLEHKYSIRENFFKIRELFIQLSALLPKEKAHEYYLSPLELKLLQEKLAILKQKFSEHFNFEW